MVNILDRKHQGRKEKIWNFFLKWQKETNHLQEIKRKIILRMTEIKIYIKEKNYL